MKLNPVVAMPRWKMMQTAMLKCKNRTKLSSLLMHQSSSMTILRRRLKSRKMI